MQIDLDELSARHALARATARPALHAVTLHVAQGEQVAVIGPSGAGKTSLMEVLACALPPAQGRLHLGGLDPWRLGRGALQRLRGQLFLAPQVPPLPPRQRVVTAVLAARLPAQGLLASVRSLFYPSDIPGAFEALEQFGLGSKLFERVDRLSGGERQRVGLARALLAPARLWLIDEPLSALDPERARQAIAALVALARARQATLVATLHQVDAALAHFPRIVGLRDGGVAFDLPTAHVTSAHLERLYAQHEDELHGTAPAAPGLGDASEATLVPRTAPAVMHCR